MTVISVDFRTGKVTDRDESEPLLETPGPRARYLEGEQRCTECEHVFLGVKGIYCGMFNEIIVSDEVAVECSEYSPY